MEAVGVSTHARGKRTRARAPLFRAIGDDGSDGLVVDTTTASSADWMWHVAPAGGVLASNGGGWGRRAGAGPLAIGASREAVESVVKDNQRGERTPAAGAGMPAAAPGAARFDERAQAAREQAPGAARRAAGALALAATAAPIERQKASALSARPADDR
eukprot:CAMPEP_0206022668 /NCGR_PEP_ID=MMETSP1464-20131121/35116_1 /ASSEMBLY_ACC=CAM_ASM_001124 /TAXON_ID=119497 /ORGANISM="Exanthemachrysis gayraliae, Strain RCC1523" /LENGTH=158 /DNA_ID=CAMNT_0053396639 /DNA_START=165 /DNA_END=636 /DNA_ORIENTATION=-